jgi:hypothetical protein
MNARRTAAVLALTALAIGGTAATASAGTKWTAPSTGTAQAS